MALIELHHVIPISVAVDPSTNPNFTEGDWAQLDSLGQAQRAAGASGTRAIGPVGDTSSTTAAGTAYAADLVIGAHGPSPTARTRSTQNRVSDAFNETAASGKITIYIAGGLFETDQYETLNGVTPIVYQPGEPLYVSANGNLTDVASANSQIVGVVTVGPRAYPSGVPGTDTTDGSLSLGNYLQFMLSLQ